MKRISREKIANYFKVLINSLYEHQSYEENEKIAKAFDKRTKEMGGNLKAIVKVVSHFKKEDSQTVTYEIQDAVANGIDLPDDAIAFEVFVDVYSTVKEGTAVSSGVEQLFRSLLFVLNENAKVLPGFNAPEGMLIINNMAMYSAKTGDRIRFGKEDIVEL